MPVMTNKPLPLSADALKRFAMRITESQERFRARRERGEEEVIVSIEHLMLTLDGFEMALKHISVLEEKIKTLEKTSAAHRYAYARAVEERKAEAAVEEQQGYCRGNCSRGGDGPSCGKIGCRG